MFMILVIISATILFFLPMASFMSDLFYLKLYIYKFENLTPDSEIQFGFVSVLPLILINFGIIGLMIYTILQYKNRILQVRLVRFGMLLTMVFMVAVFFLYPNLIDKATEITPQFETGAYFPIANIVFLFLANQFILKDEKMIRSMDRLR